MQGTNLVHPVVAQMVKDAKEGSGNPNSNGDSSSDAHVSIAYAEGGRQPIVNNAVSFFSAQVDRLFGSDEPSAGEDDDNGKDRKVLCYCLPFLSCGRGEGGKATIRLISALVFPLFLLCVFLMNDVGRTVMRNMRLKNGIPRIAGKGSLKSGESHPAIRRKTLQVFPGIRREIMWVPLERTLNIDAKTNVQASMKCPRGILFLFHGCNRYAASFFYSPQGRKIVSLAYNAGVAIVAFEKKDEMACWHWEEDGEPVLRVGQKFVSSRLLGACGKDDNGDVNYPPIYAFGASSGGSFVAALATRMEEEPKKYSPFLFSAINIQIMSPPDSLDWNIPSIFTVMDGDEETKARVQARVSQKVGGGPFKMMSTSGQKGIHPDHFSQLYHDDKQMSEGVSYDMHQDLVNLGIIDPDNNNLLLGDPRQKIDAVASMYERYGMESRKTGTLDDSTEIRVRSMKEGYGMESRKTETFSTEIRVRDNVASLKERYGMESRKLKALDDSTEILPFGVSHELSRPLRADELSDANSIWLIEELNVAWDMHEITAEGFGEVLAFFFEFGSR